MALQEKTKVADSTDVVINPATIEEQQNGNGILASLDGKDFATEATLNTLRTDFFDTLNNGTNTIRTNIVSDDVGLLKTGDATLQNIDNQTFTTSQQVTDINTTTGATTDAGVTGDNPGTISAKLRGVTTELAQANAYLGSTVAQESTLAAVQGDTATINSNTGGILNDLEGATGTLTGSIASNGQSVSLALTTASIVGVQITGTWIGTLVFEATIDNINWDNIYVEFPPTDVLPLYNDATGTTINGIFLARVGGYNSFRVRSTAWTSGTADITYKPTGLNSNVSTNWLLSAIRAATAGINGSIDVPLSTRASEATTATLLTEADFDTKIGDLTETAPVTDTASSGLNGRLQRIAQRLTSLIALFPATIGQKLKAGSLSVTMASDQESMPAYLTANATGGASTFHLVSAATTNATNIKASPGKILGITVANTTNKERKVAFHNTAGTPTAGTGVVRALFLQGDTTLTIQYPAGIDFSTGIAITTVTGIADANATAVAANDLIIDIDYI